MFGYQFVIGQYSSNFWIRNVTEVVDVMLPEGLKYLKEGVGWVVKIRGLVNGGERAPEVVQVGNIGREIVFGDYIMTL